MVAALAGTSIVKLAQGISSDPFLYAYLAMVALGLAALLVISRLQLPPPPVATVEEGSARPLRQIMRQPAFITALTGSAAGYGVMMLVMTATPLAMLQCGQPDSASVIQWHVLGMFVPSFFTGHLIARFGVLNVMLAGILLLAGHVAIALSGDAYLHLLSGLILLGMGWNFLFIGGTALLTETYRPSERARTQATHDFLVFGVMSAGSFAAGSLLDRFGWQMVNWVALPILVFALVAVLMLAWSRRKAIA